MNIKNTSGTIHEELAITIAVRKQLFYIHQFQSSSTKLTSVHFQLKQTIRQHKAAMYALNVKVRS